MCAPPPQETSLDTEGIDTTKETVIQGVVTAEGAAVPNAYVRLLDASGEFTAEVVSSATGQFRFFAAPGEWTVRALHAKGSGQVVVSAGQGVNTTDLVLAG